MRERIKQPSCLSESQSTNSEKDLFAQGGFTRIVELSSVAPPTSECVPCNSLLKEYKYGEYDYEWKEMFEGDNIINLENSEIVSMFKELKDNNTNGKIPTMKRVAEDLYQRRLDTRHDCKEFYDELKKNRPERYKEYEKKIEIEEIQKDPKYVAKIIEEWSLPNIAKKLKERHEQLKNFFQSQCLVNFVVPTNFIIGAEKNETDPSRDGKKHIYEIQQKIDPIEIPKNIFDDIKKFYLGGYGFILNFTEYAEEEIKLLILNNSEKLANFLKKQLTKDQLIKNITELDILINAVKKIPDELGVVPYDILLPNNMFITADGFRLVDTNQSMPLNTESKDIFLEEDKIMAQERSERLIKFWETVRDNLDIAEK